MTDAPGRRTHGVLRTDDLRTGGRSTPDRAGGLLFADAARPPRQVLAAHAPADVVGVLTQVEDAVAAGSWAVGFVAYEAAGAFDAALVTRPAAPRLPLVWFALTDRPRAVPAVPLPAAVPRLAWSADTEEAAHAAAVAGVRDRIARGETYQTNLTLRLRADLATQDGPDGPAVLYAGLVHAQRGAHGAFLDTGDGVVVASASPEAFFAVHEDGSGRRRLVTRPMKGTAPRGRSSAEDDDAVARLAASAKERAENVMIVDLLRNDLHRVCEPGSVEVSELLSVETYPTVHQVVSAVEGDLRPGTTTVDVFRALFPCGSVTGAPKASTTAAIAALERSPRGVYCGAVGWLAPPGEPVTARFSVAIRTAVLTEEAVPEQGRRGWRVEYGTGSGVTWDSRAGAEHRELLAKAAVLGEPPRAPFGLLETLGHHPAAGLVDVERHLVRLAASARFCGVPCDVDAARTALRDAVAAAGGGLLRVRLELRPDGGVDVTTAPAPPPSSSPVRLALEPQPQVDSADWRPRHKTTRRAWIDALRTRYGVGTPGGPDDVLWTNERGEVCEASVATLAVRLDGRWWTPPVECGLLPGVLRGRLLDAGALDLRVMHAVDVQRAEALAVLSSLRGWQPATLL